MKLALVLLLLSSARAQDGLERRDHEIKATGLSPTFPAELDCPNVASPYGSPARYDGSVRRGDRNGGLHGGMDITLKKGTPLLAVADGEVLTAGKGGRLEGNFLWLRYAPADTGLEKWVFMKYQHLAEVPDLKEGAKVKAGQQVAVSGDTGTDGGHFSGGYAHLHLTTFYGPSPDYEIRGRYDSMVRGQDSVIDDPLLLYARGKEVPVSALAEGASAPASRVVWPVRCRPKAK